MYEHAYHLDFGTGAAAYVDAVMRNLHWERVAARYGCATAAAPRPAATLAVAPEALREKLEAKDDVVVLDVCLADDMKKRRDMVPGALIRAPESIGRWADELPRDREIVVYCVYGFQVSGEAVAELRRRGLDAKPLAGGIAAWHAIGAPVAPLPAATD
jgi:Fe-Mn family superoxide dismutase